VSALLRVLAIVIAIGVAWFLLHSGKEFIQAPVKAELNAALGDNKALAKGIEDQNKGVDALAEGAKKRKAASAAAVKAAGNGDLDAAAKIMATPAKGSTPLERAANRINAEFGP
jgi:hypothetical protein